MFYIFLSIQILCLIFLHSRLYPFIKNSVYAIEEFPSRFFFIQNGLSDYQIGISFALAGYPSFLLPFPQSILWLFMAFISVSSSYIDRMTFVLPDGLTFFFAVLVLLFFRYPLDTPVVLIRLAVALIFIGIGFIDSMGDMKFLACLALSGGVFFSTLTLITAIYLLLAWHRFSLPENTAFGPYLYISALFWLFVVAMPDSLFPVAVF